MAIDERVKTPEGFKEWVMERAKDSLGYKTFYQEAQHMFADIIIAMMEKRFVTDRPCWGDYSDVQLIIQAEAIKLRAREEGRKNLSAIDDLLDSLVALNLEKCKRWKEKGKGEKGQELQRERIDEMYDLVRERVYRFILENKEGVGFLDGYRVDLGRECLMMQVESYDWSYARKWEKTKGNLEDFVFRYLSGFENGQSVVQEAIKWMDPYSFGHGHIDILADPFHLGKEVSEEYRDAILKYVEHEYRKVQERIQARQKVQGP